MYRGASLIGSVADLAIAPDNSDEIVTAGTAGVFRSVDGGRSWTGLNKDCPTCLRRGCWIFPRGIKAPASRLSTRRGGVASGNKARVAAGQ